MTDHADPARAPYSRRHIIKMAGAGVGIAAAHAVFGDIGRAAAAGPTVVGGTDLSGWQTVVGDGLWVGPGQAPVTLADISTQHLGSHSVLAANVGKRGVMAHNITFVRRSALPHRNLLHTAEVEFRLPQLPTTSNWSYNAQTLEVGLFVWDGPDTRTDYGIAIQWVLNPWVPEFGSIRVWSQNQAGPAWKAVDTLVPDTDWHHLALLYRPDTSNATLRIDNDPIAIDETITNKHDDWGTTIDGRFQVEIVSVWPGSNASVPAHRAEFRNWSWSTSSS